jgi:glycosyltransferase involved in cell wall biosynthesis
LLEFTKLNKGGGVGMVTLVVTQGSGSLNSYSQKLAQKLDVPKVYTDIYQRVGERFNISWLSKEALEAIPEDWSFIKTLNKLNGIVHLPNQHLGRYGNFLKMPYIITVHDLIRYFDLRRYGMYIHRPNRRDKFYLTLDYKGVKKAVKIIAVSQATKKDLMYYLEIPEERISVIYEGIDHAVFKPLARPNKFGYPYILFVGSEHPRKNLSTLLRAFKRLEGQPQFKNLKLVKVGKAGGREVNFRAQTMEVINTLNLNSKVVFTEVISVEDLRAYYCGAQCFALPSMYEGFGFPPLEAMACGCPVITSDGSSLPEVVDEAAIKVTPQDVGGLATVLEKVLTNQELKKNLIDRGMKQAVKFSWERTAKETRKVYQEVEESLGV